MKYTMRHLVLLAIGSFAFISSSSWADSWVETENPDPFSQGNDVLIGKIEQTSFWGNVTLSCTDALWVHVDSYNRSRRPRAFKAEYRQNPLSNQYEQFTDIKYKASTGIIRTEQVPLENYSNEIEFVLFKSDFSVLKYEDALPIIFGFDFLDGRGALEIPNDSPVRSYLSKCSSSAKF